jgi:hypothetical protein
MAIDKLKSSALLDGSIDTADVANDAITSAKIDSASTGMALADLAVDGSTLVVNATDNMIGIGDNTPSHKLDIKEDGTTAGIRLQHGGSNSYATIQGPLNRNLRLDINANGDTDGVHIRDLRDGSNVLEVQAGGDLVINDGNLVVAAGHGISFAADANNADMSSELFDDYEEGTFTPFMRINNGVEGITFGHRFGVYTKVGNQVTCMINMNMTSKGTNVGEVTIDGLPFTAGDQLQSTSYNGTTSFTYFHSLASSVSSLGGWVDDGTTECRLRHIDGSGNTNTQTTTNTKIQNNSDFRFYITYFAV